jgi:hypothetical protein
MFLRRLEKVAGMPDLPTINMKRAVKTQDQLIEESAFEILQEAIELKKLHDQMKSQNAEILRYLDYQQTAHTHSNM